MFDDEDDKMFFQALGPLKNLKTLKLKHKYVQNAVLSDKIEALYLYWKDYYTDYSPNNEENINNFIRGPGVKYLYMNFSTITLPDVTQNVDYSFLSTVDLRRYFPMLEKVKGEHLEENAAYKVLKSNEPLCDHILEWI